MNWEDAVLALRLFAIDPSGLGGVALRAGAGPVRDLWLEGLRGALAPGAAFRRVPAGIDDDRLLGGLDLAATLRTGRPVVQNGVLAEADGGVVVIAMAERLDTGVAARIVAALDRHGVTIARDGIAQHAPTRFGVVALDEGASEDEQIPAALAERLAFHIDLRALSWRGVEAATAAGVAEARAWLDSVAPADDAIVEALAATALSFAIDSIRAPMLALRTARAAAALAGRTRITDDDAVLAARLVLSPRAHALPSAEEKSPNPDDQQNRGEPPEEPAPPREGDAPDQTQEELSQAPALDEILCEAVRAALPEGLLQILNAGSLRNPPARSGGGAAQSSPRRGRPAGVRMGALKPGARLGLVETLRAAAPWQPLRRAERGDATTDGPPRIAVRREDFRIRKFIHRRESTTVFCVDASGSAAFHRLAEAKGAVELLLGEAYVARNFAALIAFRGAGAELLLPPTRSLARARALLSHLPGGGGTPLAAGLEMALRTMLGERARGRDPLLVVLTDGRANIARDGRPARPGAQQDAMAVAKQFAAQRIGGIFIDTSPRPREEGSALAQAMGARYVPLPFAQAAAMRDVVRAVAGVAPVR